MKTLALLAVLATATVVCAQPTDKDKDEMRVRARAMLAALVKEEFADAGKDFDDTMKKALPEDKLRSTWKSVLGSVGKYQKEVAAGVERKGKYDVVVLTSSFEKAVWEVRVTFTDDKKITGLFFTPAFEYKAPPYVQADSFTETEVKIGAGDWPLPGTLTTPKGDGPFPALVLVHGSGPHDRDETIGPNMPFRDLAWGLATQGIAVLRYEKRTKHYSGKMAEVGDKLTVKEEVIEDAVAAVAALGKSKKIDSKKIFLLGHSLGAVLGPRIAVEAKDLAGFIALAGATRPIEDLVLEQMTYILTLDGPLDDEGKKRIEKIKADIARLRDLKPSPDTPGKELLLGASAVYWLSLRGCQPAAEAANLTLPILILQGERDYQVTMEDFQGWKKALEGKKHATLKSYPKLNHLFVAGEGKSKPAEYAKEGHVNKEVIDDIAKWIKAR